MSEQNAPPAVTPGSETSEYRLTKMMVVIGVVLQSLAGVLATLPQDLKWVAVASALCGTVLQVLTVLGYVKGRTVLKAEAVRAALPPSPPPAPPQPQP